MSGFALLEVAVALCIIGVLAAMTMPIVKIAVAHSSSLKSERAFNHAFHSLAVFAKTYDRLPFPADTETSGVESESMKGQVGFIPYKTLGLEHASVIDGNGATLLYMVDSALTYAVPKTKWDPQKNNFMLSYPASKIEILLADKTPALAPDLEIPDFCALVLISIPVSARHTISSVVQHAHGRTTVIASPSSGDSPMGRVKVRWVSRNNLISTWMIE